MDLDYERFGRQIALAELGAQGQRALARAPVRFEGDGSMAAALELAAMLHARAGGVSAAYETEAAHVVALPRANLADGREGPAVLGIAAWAAVEAARRVLGQPPCLLPEALLARLGAYSGGSLQ